ncbi:MAG: hypothetical protein Q7O66_00775 [Dehalococcoidia bacterium]|nr:hypothetical protein [Dehalococcoidia bacterium]
MSTIKCQLCAGMGLVFEGNASICPTCAGYGRIDAPDGRDEALKAARVMLREERSWGSSWQWSYDAKRVDAVLAMIDKALGGQTG